MRPHRLRVQAFGAFAATERVSFDDLEGLFLLHGETGAGKTTLLDAIAFALYGRVPGERGKTRRLRSDHAAAGVRTEVELEATIGGRRLRITRKPEQERPKKSGTGTVREQASVLLEEATPDGGWEVKSTRVGEADAEIADLMGMSADQFFQVVLLPQGRFAQFLHADAKDRADLLQQLFGTDRFAAVEDWLAERRRASATDVAVAAEGVDRLLARVAQAAGVAVPESQEQPVAPEAWQAAWTASLAASAVAARDEAAARVDARKHDLDVAQAAQRQAEQLADRQRRRQEALGRQAQLAAAAPEIDLLRATADAATQAAEVASVLAAADRATADAEAARQAEARARVAIPGDPDGADGATALRDAGPDALRDSAEEQRARLGRLDVLRAVARQAADEDDNATAARAQAATIARTLGEAQAVATGRQHERPRAEAARDAASVAAAELPAAQAAADAARRAATTLADLAESRTDRGRAAEAHRLAADEANGLNMEYRRVRQARIDGMRAELAKDLVDGSPCPVCGSPDHPELCELPTDWVSREAEEDAYAAAGAAAEKADEAGREVVAADTVIADLVKRLAEAGYEVPGEAVALAARTQQAQSDANRLEAETSGLREAAAGLPALQRALDELDAAIAADTARLTGLTEQHAAALAEAEAADRRAADRRAEVRAQLGGSTDVDTAIATASRLADALTAAADAAERTERTAAEARDARDRAIRAAADAGFATDAGDADGDDAGDADGGATAVTAARAAFRDASWRRDAAGRITGHDTEAKAVAALLADPDLAVELDPPAPVAETTAKAAEAQREHDAANSAHGEAKHTAEQLAVLKPRLEDALATLEPLRARAEEVRQLADLAEGRGANQYKMTLSSFVLAARLEEVAQAASERLLTMTSGRYSLVHTDARRRSGAKSGLGLLACDAWTGVDRDTSTLSGGETFLASLALALGLADVVTAEAAGTPMEALFVDEGFGTLDEDTLDEVMNVLDGLRAGGRIVGIVSHVAELRQRIPAQVHVRKGQHGSHVTVTAG
jgi:DNA repair protein SbcC/Rad50